MEEKEAQAFLQSFQLLIANSNIENVLLTWQKSLCEMPPFELKMLLLIYYYYGLNCQEAYDLAKDSTNKQKIFSENELQKIRAKYILKIENKCKALDFYLPNNIDSNFYLFAIKYIVDLKTPQNCEDYHHLNSILSILKKQIKKYRLTQFTAQKGSISE